MLTFIRGKLSDLVMQQLISSLMLSKGKTSSGWLLVETGERYIQAWLVTTKYKRLDKKRQSRQISFVQKSEAITVAEYNEVFSSDQQH